MRYSLILTAAALTAFAPIASAQSTINPPSQTAAPVMPAPREPTNPNANMTPLNNGLYEGRAFAPAPMREPVAPQRNGR